MVERFDIMNNKSALDYAKMCADNIMNKFTPAALPPEGRFHYHQGVFLAGVERIYHLTNDEKYIKYLKEWVDLNIDENGNSDTCYLTEFDDIQPGILLFYLYDQTGDERYKIMLDKMNDAIEKWPTNAKGGVWHKYYNPNQMWLDTMYMMGVFEAMYASRFDNSYMFEKIYMQMKLMYDYMKNPETGLMYHMWDDSRQHERVDKETGLIRVHWGRAMGWYLVALAEIMEYAPKESLLYKEAKNIEIELIDAISKYQDKESGLWYQVLDKTDNERNWLETSCTSLFTYAAAKSYRLGIIGDKYRDMILSGYNGVLSKTEIKGNVLSVTGVCIGTGVGKIDYYYDRPIITDDLHGTGIHKMLNNI